jgi:hypothetical protein
MWVVARADSQPQTIQPAMNVKKDVEETRSLLKGRDVLSIRNRCVDLKLYNLTDARSPHKEGISLNDLAATLVKGDAEISILYVPDALVALSNFPGKIKIVGAITYKQVVGIGIAKKSPTSKTVAIALRNDHGSRR